MESKRIYQGKSLENMAKFLGQEFRDRYREVLTMFKEESLDDLKNYRWAEEHLITDLNVIEEETFERLLEIACNRRQFRNFYKKWNGWPRSRSVISITGDGNFFSRCEFNLAIGLNIEYLVNVKKFTVVRYCYPL